MQPSDVLIAVPTRGTVQWSTATRLEAIRDRYPGMAPILYEPGNLSVALTRNRIVKKFMDGPWQALAMIDDDVIPAPHFLELAAHLDGSEFGMVCMPHPMPNPKNQGQLMLGIFAEVEGGFIPIPPQRGLHECDAVATGAVVISRAALVTVGKHPFRITHDPDAEVQSDDLLFCRDLRKHGLKVGYYMDGWFSDHHSVVALAPLVENAMEAIKP